MKKGFILSITDCPFQSQSVSQTKKLINTVFEVIEPGMTNLHDCAISNVAHMETAHYLAAIFFHVRPVATVDIPQ